MRRLDYVSGRGQCAIASGGVDGRDFPANIHTRFAAKIGSIARSRGETVRTENKR